MGAMKRIFTDIQELQAAANRMTEDEFADYVDETGWISPTEVEAGIRRGDPFLSLVPRPTPRAAA